MKSEAQQPPFPAGAYSRVDIQERCSEKGPIIQDLDRPPLLDNKQALGPIGGMRDVDGRRQTGDNLLKDDIHNRKGGFPEN